MKLEVWRRARLWVFTLCYKLVDGMALMSRLTGTNTDTHNDQRVDAFVQRHLSVIHPHDLNPNGRLGGVMPCLCTPACSRETVTHPSAWVFQRPGQHRHARGLTGEFTPVLGWVQKDPMARRSRRAVMLICALQTVLLGMSFRSKSQSG